VKYSVDIEIDLPRARVVELFDNPDNLKHWQPGLVSFEAISGVPGEPGGRSRLRYQMGKKEIEMIETITERNLPETFSGTYEAKGVWNEVVNRFVPLANDRTQWVLETDFRFKGMMRLMGWLMPGAFKKQSLEFMQLFKQFAEKQGPGTAKH
jgi:hypothetical protein